MSNRKLRKGIKRICNLPFNKYLLKYVLNKLRFLLLKITRSLSVAYPSTVMIELGNHCNLSCTTCPREYDYGRAMDKGFMPVDEARKVIDELWPYLDSIGLTGMGETFMYEDLEEVVDYIRSKNRGIIISVSTNAVLPGFIKKVSPLINKIDTIQISIDGLGDTYERIRLNAGFNRLSQNLDELAAICNGSDTILMLNMVVTKENYHQMAEMVKFSQEKGITYMDFTLFNLASVTGIDAEYYEFYNSPEFINSLCELKRESALRKKVKVTLRDFNGEKGFRRCPFPWTHFYICQDGYLAPCCAKPFPKEKNFGNIKYHSVIDILNNDEFKAWRRDWTNNITPDFCRKCNFIEMDPVMERKKIAES